MKKTVYEPIAEMRSTKNVQEDLERFKQYLQNIVRYIEFYLDYKIIQEVNKRNG